MSAIVVLILRILLAICLYLFLGWALYTIWLELRLKSHILRVRRTPVIQITNPSLNESFEYAVNDVQIGRDPNCDFNLEDDTVSSRHAQLSFHHNQWWVVDLDSTNGTFLNDERVYTPTVIVSGDHLRCGKVGLEILIQNSDENP